jgi:hypothetical protein
VLSHGKDKQAYVDLFHKGHIVRLAIIMTSPPKDTSIDKLLQFADLTNGKNLTIK